MNADNYEVMKFLLFALLGCVCSADYELSDKRLLKFGEDVDDELVAPSNGLPSFARTFQDFQPYVDARGARDDRVHLQAYSNAFRFENPETHHPIRHGRRQFRSMDLNAHVQTTWPVKKEAVVEGDLVLGGLMMVHEREDTVTCGPVMAQGGVQALEAMLYTLDKLNENEGIVPGVKIGAHILDDCDKDTYGLEMAVDFIKGE